MITKASFSTKEQDVLAIPELLAILDAWENVGISGLSNVNPQIKALSVGELQAIGEKKAEHVVLIFC